MDFTGHFFLRVPYARTDSAMDRSTDSAMVLTVLRTVVLSVLNSTDSTSGHFFMTCTVHVLVYLVTFLQVSWCIVLWLPIALAGTATVGAVLQRT